MCLRCPHAFKIADYAEIHALALNPTLFIRNAATQDDLECWSRSARLVTMLCRNAVITCTLLLKSLIFGQWFIKIQLAKQKKTLATQTYFTKD